MGTDNIVVCPNCGCSEYDPNLGWCAVCGMLCCGCDKPELECICERCPDCGNRVDECECMCRVCTNNKPFCTCGPCPNCGELIENCTCERCPDCGELIEDCAFEHCPGCGKHVEDMFQCSNCGYPYVDRCPNCGEFGYDHGNCFYCGLSIHYCPDCGHYPYDGVKCNNCGFCPGDCPICGYHDYNGVVCDSCGHIGGYCSNCGEVKSRCECEYNYPSCDNHILVDGVYCPNCGYETPEWNSYVLGTGEVSYHIKGTCPTNIESLYLSVIDKSYKLSDVSESYTTDDTFNMSELVANHVKTYDFMTTCTSCSGLGVGTDGIVCDKCDGTGAICVNDGTFEFKLIGRENGDDVDYISRVVIWSKTKTQGSIVITSLDIFQYDEAVCLSGDTLITMADGSTKCLDMIHVGDVLCTPDGPATVTRLGRNVWRPTHKLHYFEDGTIIDEISTHRFYNVDQGFWQKLEMWNIGEHALNQNGEKVALVKVEIVDEEAECFGLWTTNDKYYANGLLSGGAENNRPLLADATLEQAVDMAVSLDEAEIEKMFFGGVL